MKKILTVVIVCAFLFSACGSSESITTNSETSSFVEEAQIEEETEVETEVSAIEDISYASMISNPNEIFSNGKIQVTDQDGGKAYIFQVSEYQDGEFEKYIAETKKMGFDKVSYETPESFGAYTQDKEYWAELHLDTKNEIIYVICNKSKKK